MIRKFGMLLFVLILLFSYSCDTPTFYSETESYASQKIVLGHFKLQTGKPVLGNYAIRWWEMNFDLITTDDNHRLYALDMHNKKVDQFTPDGKFIKEIALKEIDFPHPKEPYNMLRVSSTGKYLYIVGGENEYKWTIFNDDGAAIKKDIFQIDFNRKCQDEFITSYNTDILDVSLNVVRRIRDNSRQGEFVDSKDNIYSLRQNFFGKISLKKTSLDGKIIWEKRIKNYGEAIKIIGVDGGGSAYLLMDRPFEIIKLDEKGNQVSKIALPFDRPIMDDRIRMGDQFQILCDGTIYYIPPLRMFSKEKYKAFLSIGEYAIYKFERIK